MSFRQFNPEIHIWTVFWINNGLKKVTTCRDIRVVIVALHPEDNGIFNTLDFLFLVVVIRLRSLLKGMELRFSMCKKRTKKYSLENLTFIIHYNNITFHKSIWTCLVRDQVPGSHNQKKTVVKIALIQLFSSFPTKHVSVTLNYQTIAPKRFLVALLNQLHQIGSNTQNPVQISLPYQKLNFKKHNQHLREMWKSIN